MPFDSTTAAPPTVALAPDRRSFYEEVLAIVTTAQRKIAKRTDWNRGSAEAFSRGRRRICATQALYESSDIGSQELQEALRLLAHEAPATIRQFALSDQPAFVIQRANDCGPNGEGYGRIMGMFCRAITKLEARLAV